MSQYYDPNPRPTRRRQQERSESGLYLPAWAVLATIVIVCALVGSIIAVVIALGGRAEPGGEPIVQIITAAPSNTPLIPTAAQLLLPTPTDFSPAETLPVEAFALQGPALPTAIISPTPDTIAIGKTVVVVNVGENGLNVRSAAGIGNNVLFTAPEDTLFDVIGGPESADNLTWWQVRGVSNPSQVGWAAENNGEQDLLQVAAP
jgi:hypothetical protein